MSQRISSRRRRLAAVAFAGGVLAACAGETRPVPVVLIVIDTLRADRVGAYGYARPTTPRLDALAAEGVVFEQAYAPAPWTLPSVVSLMTSTFPCEHGVVLDGQRLSPDVATLAERLRAAGYATASFYANAYAGPTSGLARGFASAQYVPWAEPARLEAWLDRVGERPFFLYVHHVEPHDPYTAQPQMVAPFGPVGARQHNRANELLLRYRRLTRADYDAGTPRGTTDNTAEQREALGALRRLAPSLSALYDGDVRLADERLGAVIDTLVRRGVWDGALVVLVSDHGEELGEHGAFQHDQSVYEELLRVPFVIRFPGGAHAGRRVSGPVSLVDVLPTVADALGRPELARGARGRSLLPRLRGGAAHAAPLTAMRENRKKYFRPIARARGDVNVVVREGPWKGIWNADLDTVELYRLDADPGEKRDLAAAESERSQRVREDARRWLAACRERGEATPPASVQPSEETRARLRDLGYAE